MRTTSYKVLACGLVLAGACGGEDGPGGAAAHASLATASNDDPGAGAGRIGEFAPVEEEGDDPPEEPPTELDCERGGPTGNIRVAFRCDEITVRTCKDLSNIVVEYEDGTRERYEGQKGHENEFGGAGAAIARVWVKAGSNASGEGPGYGERFEAPAESCDPGREVDRPETPGTGAPVLAF